MLAWVDHWMVMTVEVSYLHIHVEGMSGSVPASPLVCDALYLHLHIITQD